MIINKSEQEKRDDIVAHVDKSIFVEAGAGAGKTTLIVQRITNQIRQGFLSPEELVVITFTNKAAGELFERIQKSFEVEEKNPENTQEQRARFTYAIEHMEQMHISTIHSFCFSLLRERCFDAKLPLDVSLLENADTLDRQKRFLSKWSAAQSRVTIEDIKQKLMVANGDDSFYMQKLEAAFLKICEKPEDVNFVSLSSAELQQLEQDIDAAVQKEEQLLKDLNDELVTIANKLADIYQQHMGISIYSEYKGIKLKKFYEFLPDGFPREGSGASTYKNYVESFYKNGKEVQFCNRTGRVAEKNAYIEIDKKMNEWLNLSIRPVNLYGQWEAAKTRAAELKSAYGYHALMEYAIKAREEYQKQLDATKLSNDQLIQKAKALVWESKDACEYFAKKYKCIYVDEFQDTDHIQADLIWKLCSNEMGVLKQGSLFVVGDPKQAIYRFRGGEPAVYDQIKKRMIADAEAEVHELDNNFRSNKEIIEWVNGAFKSPITNSGITYRDMICVAKNHPEEVPVGAEADKVLKGVYHLETLTGRVSGIKPAEYEAAVLAALIQRIVTNKYLIYENKKTDTGYIRKLRPIHYGDFLILCWNTTQMDYYMDALKELSIPVDLAGKADISESSVLKRFVSLYRYLLHPFDEKSKQVARQIVCRKDVLEDIDIANQRVQFLFEETKLMNCYAKVQYLLMHMEYILPWEKEISKEDMYILQARLHQMVECVLALAKDAPENILQFFEEYIVCKLEQELMLEENHKAVRFMNLHKAKGLEGNITILTNRRAKKEHTPEYTSSKCNADQKYDYYGCISDGYTSFDGYGYDAASKAVLADAKEQERAESIRLDYVAATRAKEVLLVTQKLEEGAVFSSYTVPEEHDMAFVFQKKEEDPKPRVAVATVQGGRSIYERATEDMVTPSHISLSPSSLEGSDSKPNEQSEGGKNRRPKGNIFGTTMHRSFELFIQKMGDKDTCIMQAIIENKDELLLEGERLYLKEGEEKEVYLQAVKEFLQQALEKWEADEAMQTLLKDAKEVHTELPFTYYTSPKQDPELFAALGKHLEAHKIYVEENQEVCVDGTADLVVLDAQGKLHIIDFKSDTNKEESVEVFEYKLYDKYEGQLLLYKYSMSRVFNLDLSQISTELYHLYK